MKTFDELSKEEKLELCEAVMDGKAIQRHLRICGGDVLNEKDVILYADYVYRIKPEPRTRWISVEDRLPTQGEVYRVKRKGLEDAEGFFYLCTYTWGCFGEVTHWMERPEALNLN